MKKIKTFESFTSIVVSSIVGSLIGSLIGKLVVRFYTNDSNLRRSLQSLKELSEQGSFVIDHDGDLIKLKADVNRVFVIDKKNRRVGYNFNRPNDEFPMNKMNRTDFDVLVSGVEYIEKFDREIPDCLQELVDNGFAWEVSSFDPMTKNFAILFKVHRNILFDEHVYSKKHKRDYAKFKEEVPPMLEEAIDRIEGEMNIKLTGPSEKEYRYLYYITRHNGSLMAFGNNGSGERNKFIGDIYKDHFYYESFGNPKNTFKLFFKTNV